SPVAGDGGEEVPGPGGGEGGWGGFPPARVRHLPDADAGVWRLYSPCDQLLTEMRRSAPEGQELSRVQGRVVGPAKAALAGMLGTWIVLAPNAFEAGFRSLLCGWV